jgi:hypothetical protein
MADRLKKKPATRRDAVDAARLKLQGDPSHINAREDRLLRETMPEAHGRVVTRGLLAEAGRRGDDRVTLLTEREAALLKARGGAGTRNPASGLLEYNNSGDSDDGSSSNTSSAGENTGGMDGTANSGVSEGPGANGGYGSNDGGYGGLGGYGAYSGGPYGGGQRSRGLGGAAFGTPSIESVLNAPSGYLAPGYEDISFTQYAPQDTWGRVVQEYFNPHPGLARAAPGRYGAPTAAGPGIMGTMAGMLTGQPMSAMMGIGAAMGRASSPATQAANAAAESARSGVNSGGNQGNHSVLDMDAKIAARAALGGAAPAGAASGAQTAEMVGAPGVAGLSMAPGYTVNAAGQVVPTSEARTMTGLPAPVENLLADYIWRGRQGSGWGW